MKKLSYLVLIVLFVLSMAVAVMADEGSDVEARVGLSSIGEVNDLNLSGDVTLSLNVRSSYFSGARGNYTPPFTIRTVFFYPPDSMTYESGNLVNGFEPASDPASGGHAGHIPPGGGIVVDKATGRVIVTAANRSGVSSSAAGTDAARLTFKTRSIDESRAGSVRFTEYKVYNGTIPLVSSNANYDFFMWSGNPLIGARYPANGAENVPVVTTFAWKALVPGDESLVPEVDITLEEGLVTTSSTVTGITCGKYCPGHPLNVKEDYNWKLDAHNCGKSCCTCCRTFKTSSTSGVTEVFNPLTDDVLGEEYANTMIYAGVESLALIRDAVPSSVLNNDLGVSNVIQLESGQVKKLDLSQGSELTALLQDRMDAGLDSGVTGKRICSIAMEITPENNANTVTVPMSFRLPALEVFGEDKTDHSITELFDKVAVFKCVNGVPYLMSTADNIPWFTMKVEKIDGIVVYTLAYTVVIYDGGTPGKPIAASNNGYHYFVVQDGHNDGKCVDPWDAMTITTAQTGSTGGDGGGGGCLVGFSPAAILLALPLFMMR